MVGISGEGERLNKVWRRESSDGKVERREGERGEVGAGTAMRC